jgi:hypothetical protein
MALEITADDMNQFSDEELIRALRRRGYSPVPVTRIKSIMMMCRFTDAELDQILANEDPEMKEPIRQAFLQEEGRKMLMTAARELSTKLQVQCLRNAANTGIMLKLMFHYIEEEPVPDEQPTYVGPANG